MPTDSVQMWHTEQSCSAAAAAQFLVPILLHLCWCRGWETSIEPAQDLSQAAMSYHGSCVWDQYKYVASCRRFVCHTKPVTYRSRPPTRNLRVSDEHSGSFWAWYANFIQTYCHQSLLPLKQRSLKLSVGLDPGCDCPAEHEVTQL
eukprot:2109823-Amphidinium_carterae.1